MLKYMKKYWIIAFFAAVFMVCEVGVDLIQPRMMEKIVDEGILGLNNNGVPDMDLVIRTGIKMILVVICGGLAGISCGAFTNIFSQNFGNEMRKDAFSRVMSFSFEQTDDFSAGSLITRVTSDITQVQNMAAQMTRGAVRCMMFFIGGIFALLSLDLSFGVIIACALPLIVIVIVFIITKTNPLFDLLQRRLDRMNTVIQENVNGSRVVKAFVQEDREKKRFETSNEELAETQFKVLILVAYLRPIMNIILNLATVAVIYLGGIHVQAGSLAPGSVMAAITYLSQILNGLTMIAMIFQTMSRGMVSAKRVKEVLDTIPAIQDGGFEGETEEKGTVVFDHVNFHYPGHHHEVLHDISLSIESGETLAIIGATGCGKSTLVNLIPRFYDVSDGSVLVDGKDVKEYNLKALRDRIAVVLQKSELFSTTIKENIALGKPEASMDEIERAAVTAQADDFIRRQPEGYDTAVAEGGMSLSGGQKQRISIARALLKGAEILILDDSTSALDLQTEAKLHEALRTTYGHVTKIIIAQRIATVMRADRIAVMDQGRIVGCADHDTLMETCEVYRDIYNSQLKSEEEDA